MKKLTVLSICAVFMFCMSLSSSAVASDEDDVLKVMENWFTAFNTSDSDLMASLYWKSEKTSEFWPDAEGVFLKQGWEELAAAWSFDNWPVGAVTGTNHHPHVTMLGNDLAIFTNYNTVVSTDPATKAQNIFHVRGSFVMQKKDGKWLIVHGHSSVLPAE